MKNVEKLEAVHTHTHTTLNKSGVVFHTQNNKTKLGQGRYTE